jgi:hypothetical protein
MSQTIIVDSSHNLSVRKSSASDISCNFTSFANTDVAGYNVALESFLMPNLVYPINKNNKFIYFYENLNTGVLKTATLTEGTYTSTTLATEIQTRMNAIAANVYTVTFNSVSSKLTISTTLPNTIAFSWSAATNNAAKVMGFPTTDSTFQSVKVSSYPVRLDGSLYIDIITNFRANVISSDGRSSIMARIPLSVSYGSILFWENPSLRDTAFYAYSDDFNSLNVRLVDDTGNLLPIPDNCEFSMTFKIWSDSI